MIRKIIGIIILISAAGCTSPQQVSEKVLRDLEIKYNRKFIILSVNMNRDEGNWGGANLVVCPEGDEQLKFHVNYNYSDMKLTWEDYKGALWNREISQKTASLLGVPAQDVTSVITSNNSIAFDSMNLPWHEKFADAVKDIKHPRLGLKLKMRSDNFLKSAQLISAAADKLLLEGFEKVSISADFSTSSGTGDSIKFKVTSRHRTPSAADLAELLQSYAISSIKNAGQLYHSAGEAYKEGDHKKALNIYLKIVNDFDNPYRYEPYVLLESHYVVESAFNAAEILRSRGDLDGAAVYYRLVTERLEYHEVKAELNEMYKASVMRISGNVVN